MTLPIEEIANSPLDRANSYSEIWTWAQKSKMGSVRKRRMTCDWGEIIFCTAILWEEGSSLLTKAEMRAASECVWHVLDLLSAGNTITMWAAILSISSCSVPEPAAECAGCGQVQHPCGSPCFWGEQCWHSQHHSSSFSNPGKEEWLPHALVIPAYIETSWGLAFSKLRTVTLNEDDKKLEQIKLISSKLLLLL